MLYKKIIFYYSVIVATLLFFWIIIAMPRPFAFIPLIIFFPITLHFWLSIMRPTTSKTNSTLIHEVKQKNSRLILFGAIALVTLFISSMSIFIFSLLYENYSPFIKNLPDSKNADETVSNQLKDISGRLDSLESSNADEIRQINNISDQNAKQSTLGVSQDLTSDLSKIATGSSNASGVSNKGE